MRKEQMVLEELRTKVEEANNKRRLMDLFRKLVILEITCLSSEDADVRGVGYKAQLLQNQVELKLN